MNLEGWHEIPLPPFLFPIGTKAYNKKSLRVIYSPIENQPDGLWSHLSVSCTNRYPTWDEIKETRYDFFSDSDEVFQILPPKSEYINVHQFCFHLWHAIGRRVTPG